MLADKKGAGELYSEHRCILERKARGGTGGQLFRHGKGKGGVHMLVETGGDAD